MKIYKYILSAALPFMFAACSQGEDLAPQGGSNEVKINVTVGSLQSRVSYGEAGTTTFVAGDKIKVSKNSTGATYTLGVDGKWKITEGTLIWDKGRNSFKASYPDNVGLIFELPADQSTEEKLGQSDWMTAGAEYTEKPTNEVLDLNFRHNLTKVTFQIGKWGSEYEGTEKEITDVKVYSRGSQFSIYKECDVPSYGNYVHNGYIKIEEDSEDVLYARPDGNWTRTTKEITPYEGKDGSYTAIISPKTNWTVEFLTFTVNGTDKLTVNTTTADLFYNNFKIGAHYVFTLTIGKNNASISKVEVKPWNEGESINEGMQEDGTGDGYGYDEATNTYYVNNESGLRVWAEQVNSISAESTESHPHLILTADITLTNDSNGLLPSTGDGNNWAPIINYTGTIDGGGHKIKGLMYLDRYSNDCASFIKSLGAGGIVKNLIFEDATIGSEGRSAVVCENSGTVLNCHVTGNSSVTGTMYVGGIVAQNLEGGIVSACTNAATIRGRSYCGGIVGRCDGSAIIVACGNVGVVESSSNTSGGVSGSLEISSSAYASWTTQEPIFGTAGNFVDCYAGYAAIVNAKVDAMNAAINVYNESATAENLKCPYKWQAGVGDAYPTLVKSK